MIPAELIFMSNDYIYTFIKTKCTVR